MKTVPALRFISRYFLAALFLFAAGAKLWMLNQPGENFFVNVPRMLDLNFGIPPAIGMMIAWGVVVVEVIVGSLMLVGRTSRMGAAAGGILLIGFASFALFYRFGLGNEEGLECGCFGGLIKSQLGVTTALRNLVLLIPVALVLRKRQRGHHIHLGSGTETSTRPLPIKEHPNMKMNPMKTMFSSSVMQSTVLGLTFCFVDTSVADTTDHWGNSSASGSYVAEMNRQIEALAWQGIYANMEVERREAAERARQQAIRQAQQEIEAKRIREIEQIRQEQQRRERKERDDKAQELVDKALSSIGKSRTGNNGYLLEEPKALNNIRSDDPWGNLGKALQNYDEKGPSKLNESSGDSSISREGPGRIQGGNVADQKINKQYFKRRQKWETDLGGESIERVLSLPDSMSTKPLITPDGKVKSLNQINQEGDYDHLTRTGSPNAKYKKP